MEVAVALGAGLAVGAVLAEGVALFDLDGEFADAPAEELGLVGDGVDAEFEILFGVARLPRELDELFLLRLVVLGIEAGISAEVEP